MMTPEAMRIAIAESEGWKRIPERPNPNFHKGGTSIETLPEQWQRPNGHCEYFCPNYEDLNAILPLLPDDTKIVRGKDGTGKDGWYLELHDKGRSNEWRRGYIRIFNNDLALAACEFYLKWKGLWK